MTERLYPIHDRRPQAREALAAQAADFGAAGLEALARRNALLAVLDARTLAEAHAAARKGLGDG
jgi:hypothetical protein